MSVVRAYGDLLREHSVHAVLIAGCPLLVWLAMDHGRMGTLGVMGVLALVVGVYIGMRHPLWFYWGVAFALGALPFGYFPGVHVPVYLAFAFAAVLAAVVHPSAQTKWSGVEVAVLVLVLVASMSLVGGGLSLAGIVEFTKWAIMTLAVIALLRLPRENLKTFGQIFTYAATANALFGIFMVVADRQQKSLTLFRIFGYGRDQDTPGHELGRFVFADQGQIRYMRLGGTWIDPNAGGLCMVIALAICLVVFEGWRRYCLAGILLFAILLTLSRSAIFTVLCGFLLVLIFHSMRARDRQLAIGSLFMIGVVALIVPTVRIRIFSSFGRDDTGADARTDALREFPQIMSGHWLFGLGWGRPEMKDGPLAFTLNYVANTPLLTVYRGGIFTGLAFVGVMIVGCILGYRALRSRSLRFALYGGIFISACVVALQLDHPVAVLPQITLTFSVFLAFLVYVDQSSDSPSRHAAVSPPVRDLADYPAD
jgi:polysaccharide biosynthesis protein PslJ